MTHDNSIAPRPTTERDTTVTRPLIDGPGSEDTTVLENDLERRSSGSEPWRQRLEPLQSLNEAIVGKTIAGYRFERLINSGGQGAVYSVTNGDGLRFVVKLPIGGEMMTPSERHTVDGLLSHELEVMKRLGGQSETLVLPVGKIDVHGRPGIVMEYVRGLDLHEWRKHQPNQRLPLADVLRVAAVLLDTFAQMHEHGVFHRDVKPNNLRVTTNNQRRSKWRLRLLDFGVAYLLSTTPAGEGGNPQRTVGLQAGPYHAPEVQHCFGLPTDGRTDLYSAGVVLWELLFGVRPPDNGVRADAHHSRADQSISAASVFAALQSSSRDAGMPTELPTSLIRWFSHLLAPFPDDRWNSAEQARDELTALNNEVDDYMVRERSILMHQDLMDHRREIAAKYDGLARVEGMFSKLPTVEHLGEVSADAIRLAQAEGERLGLSINELQLWYSATDSRLSGPAPTLRGSLHFFSEAIAARAHGATPPVLSASGVVVAKSERAMVLQWRSDSVHTYARALHTFGGGYQAGGHLENTDSTLSTTMFREFSEETNRDLHNGGNMTGCASLFCSEPATGYVQVVFLGLQTSFEQLRPKPNWEGSILTVPVAHLERLLTDYQHVWCPTGHMHVVCWLLAGAPGLVDSAVESAEFVRLGQRVLKSVQSARFPTPDGEPLSTAADREWLSSMVR